MLNVNKNQERIYWHLGCHLPTDTEILTKKQKYVVFGVTFSWPDFCTEIELLTWKMERKD